MKKGPFSIGLWSTVGLVLFANVPPAQGAELYCMPVSSFSINVGNVSVQRDISVGQPIGDWIESSSAVSYVECNYDYYPSDPIVSGIKSYNSFAGITYNGHAVFNTNLTGVGFIIEGKAYFNTTSSWSSWAGVSAGTDQRDLLATGHRVGFHPHIMNQARIRLIKTGDVTSGDLSGAIGSFYAGLRTRGWFSSEVPITFSGGKVTALSCSVAQSRISVRLGEQDKSQFSGIGSGTEWQDVNIMLNCNQNARINVRIDALADLSRLPGVLKIDDQQEDMKAEGVGIQLYYRLSNQPVQFGQEAFYYQSPYGGQEIVQLKARYCQTKEKITAGRANGTATFTLTYK
ncbi:fimbrial protein [Leminorella grimontii]|uniref:fimbrial protein n=1 Tax=Leminorella grimontii TaxID=82981 RepID=UPI00321F81CB